MTEIERWANLYKDFLAVGNCDTKQEADDRADRGRIATLKLTYNADMTELLRVEKV